MFRVYVDEAGTRHISAKSSRYFVVSAVMVHESHNDRAREQLSDLKLALGRQHHQILHFRNLHPPQKRVVAAAGVTDFVMAPVMSVIIDKSEIGKVGPAGNLAFIAQPDPMYFWALRLLLERVSWYAEIHQKQDVYMTFSHVQGLKVRKLMEYRLALERKHGDEDMRINWDLFAANEFHIASPKTVDLLQVADVVASSVFQAVEPGRDGPSYLDALAPKIYRRPPKPITSYGLKVFPKQAFQIGGDLQWLRQRYSRWPPS